MQNKVKENTKKNQKSRTLNIKWSLNESTLTMLYTHWCLQLGKKYGQGRIKAVKYVLWFYSFYAIQDECYNEWENANEMKIIYIIFHLYIFYAFMQMFALKVKKK